MDNDSKFIEYQSLKKHSNIIWYLSWNPVEDILCSCGADKNIYIWVPKSNTEDLYIAKVIINIINFTKIT